MVVFCPDQLGPATLRSLVGSPDSFAYPRGAGHFVDWQDYAETVANTGVENFVSKVLAEADDHNVWLVSGFGYKSFGNRCETMINELRRTHEAQQLLAPSDVFEPMLLIRYEAPR